MVLRYGNGGRLLGATFIDHNSRTVLNGFALDKEFSANAHGAWVADFSQMNRKDLQPVTSAPTKESLPTSVQLIQEDTQPKVAKGYSGDNSSVGSLLSVLIPEPD